MGPQELDGARGRNSVPRHDVPARLSGSSGPCSRKPAACLAATTYMPRPRRPCGGPQEGSGGLPTKSLLPAVQFAGGRYAHFSAYPWGENGSWLLLEGRGGEGRVGTPCPRVRSGTLWSCPARLERFPPTRRGKLRLVIFARVGQSAMVHRIIRISITCTHEPTDERIMGVTELNGSLAS